MSQRTHARTTSAKSQPAGAALQRTPALTVNQPGDRFEEEADRMAAAVMSPTQPAGVLPLALDQAPVAHVQRAPDAGDEERKKQADQALEQAVPASEGHKQRARENEAFDKAVDKAAEAKSGEGDKADDPNAEQYKKAVEKLAEAFPETPVGKEVVEKAKALGEAFWVTLHGKIITGSVAVASVAMLAATHEPLPVGIPEISLDWLKKGLKVKITYEGPVDKPTKAMITFSLPWGRERDAHKPTATEQAQAEKARLQAEHDRFERNKRFQPGSAADREQKAQEADMRRAINQRFLDNMRNFTKPAPVRQPPPAGGLQLGTPPPAYGFKPRRLLGDEYRLRPPLVPGLPRVLPDVRLTGEQTPLDAPAAEPRKKQEEAPVMRKAAHAAPVAAAPATVASTVAPPVVHEAASSVGQPLDPGTRRFMEQRFGRDFGAVRIHTDRAATAAVDAHAYTLGRDIVFAPGRYSPHTPAGRTLLAHELTHVVQQSADAGARGLASSAPVAMRKKNDSAAAVDPVDAALKGDDDDVRALTKHKDWEFKIIRPDEAAQLIIHLLDGATLDDDEQAGLVILRKMLKQLMLDATLGKLVEKRRMKQLLDDYHGSEYRELLTLLSENIKDKEVKAAYLDSFIAMWWVREHEEIAIVMLLEHTDAQDQYELLRQKNRTSELRDAIDARDPTLRYEKIVGGVNLQHGEQLKTQLSAIFKLEAKGAAGKQRTQAEIKALLDAAAKELADELLDYRRRLNEATKDPNAGPGAIAKINQEFERRLDRLIVDKKLEFGWELRYNVEFNRLLKDAYGTTWTETDLAAFDKILQKIPADILHANPKFHAFLRGKEHPKLGGWSSSKGMIAVFGDLNLSTTLHELGHNIHHGDDKLYAEFRKLSGWRWLTSDDFVTDFPDQKKAQSLLAELDDDRKHEREYTSHEWDDARYRYDRYGDGYLRYDKKATFISAYAETDPADDFAESFDAYMREPKKLQKKCPDKYRFMHVEVLVRYRLKQQASRVMADFDARVTSRIGFVDAQLLTPLTQTYVQPLRDELEQALTAQSKEKADAATKSVGAAPAPVPMTAEATAHAQPYLARLDRLLDVLHAGAVAFHTVETDLTWQQMNQPDATLIDAQDALGKALTARYKDELLPLLDKPARTARQGDKVEVEPWPALAALKAKYVKAATLVPDYLPYYNSALGMRGQFTQIAVELLRKYKAGKKVSDLRVYLVDQRDNKFLPEIEAWKAMVLDRIRTGQPFNPKQVKDPKTILGAYARRWRRAAGKIVARRRAKEGSAPAADGASVRRGLESPSKPLDAETRAFMEPRFGRDFSRVRVHTDGHAAAGAQAMNAQAFTVGDDIVFDEGRYAPHTPAGQELLAHELTHVAQQEDAAPDVTPAAAEEPRATPAIAFEQIDLPEPAVTDVAMTAALAPAALPAAATTSTPAENAAAATEPPPVTMSQPAAPADGTVAARPVDPATPAPEVVPPSHPSEQEATQVARAVVASAHGPVGAPVVRRKAPRRPQRKPGDKEDKAAGIDVVFIMGVDRNPKRNPFYREAAKYFKAKFPDATLVNDAAHRSLESVFDYVRSRGVRVANLYIVSHANEDGTLSFKLRDGDKDKDPHVQYGDLVRALRDDAARFNLPQGIIDDATNIYIKGCNIGRSSRMLDELDKAFGGAGKVIAPTHKQVFGSKRAGKGSPVEHYEALSTYFIEYKGNQRIAPADQQAAFIEKYPELPEARWKKLVPNTKKGGATRQLVAIPFTYDYGVNVKNAASKRTAQEQALAEAAAWGQENIARTDIFEWRVKSTKLSANGWLVTVVAEKTNYIVDKILVDAAGKRLAPAETDTKYFGTSTYGDDAQEAGGQGDETALLIQELAALQAALAKLPEGDERDARLARKREIEVALQARAAHVDVHVVKTEDWLGADEVYVKAGGPGQPFRAPTHKLNDGESFRFQVPLAHFAPFDQPVTLEVYDEDLGWFFDRDDLIVKLKWAPPFAPLANQESLDNADYRVRAEL